MWLPRGPGPTSSDGLPPARAEGCVSDRLPSRTLAAGRGRNPPPAPQKPAVDPARKPSGHTRVGRPSCTGTTSCGGPCPGHPAHGRRELLRSARPPHACSQSPPTAVLRKPHLRAACGPSMSRSRPRGGKARRAAVKTLSTPGHVHKRILIGYHKNITPALQRFIMS